MVAVIDFIKEVKLYNFYAKKNPSLDPRYIFINSGFNLRPMDIQAAIAKSIQRLDTLMFNRDSNRKKLLR